MEPSVSLQMSGGGSTAVKMFLLLTALSFASAILVSLTAFTRITIVLSFLRQAMGTPQLPPNQVLLGLSLALSAFVMAPTATAVYHDSLGPYLDDQVTAQVAFDKASGPIQTFLLRQTRAEDLRLFYGISNTPAPARGDEIPLTIAVPAFMVSELTTAFRMGLFIYVPFVLIDLLVSALLMTMGMMMVPPTMISLPLKVGVFLMADGWRLLVASLVRELRG